MNGTINYDKMTGNEVRLHVAAGVAGRLSQGVWQTGKWMDPAEIARVSYSVADRLVDEYQRRSAETARR